MCCVSRISIAVLSRSLLCPLSVCLPGDVRMADSEGDLEQRGWEVHTEASEVDLDMFGSADELSPEKDLEVRGWDMPASTSMPPARRRDERAALERIPDIGLGVRALVPVAVGRVSGSRPGFSGTQATEWDVKRIRKEGSLRKTFLKDHLCESF